MLQFEDSNCATAVYATDSLQQRGSDSSQATKRARLVLTHASSKSEGWAPEGIGGQRHLVGIMEGLEGGPIAQHCLHVQGAHIVQGMSQSLHHQGRQLQHCFQCCCTL